MKLELELDLADITEVRIIKENKYIKIDYSKNEQIHSAKASDQDNFYEILQYHQKLLQQRLIK